MADQAKVSGTPAGGGGVSGPGIGNGNARVRIHSPLVEGVLGNLAEFGSDVATLAELQAQLAVHDLKESAGRAILPAGLLAGSIALALGSIPVLLMGAADLIAPVLGIDEGWSLLLVAGVALLLAATLGWFALPRLTGSFDCFRRSQEELNRNLSWVKTVLTHSGRFTPNRR